MAREIFKNLPDTSTPLNATKLNGLLNGEEAMGSIVVDDIISKNFFNKNEKVVASYNTNVEVLSNGIRVKCTSSLTYTYACIKISNIEKLLGKAVTLSATFTSSASNTGRILVQLYNSKGITGSQIAVLGGNAGATSFTGNKTFTIPTTLEADGIALLFQSNAGGTSSIGDYVDYTNVQLELGENVSEYTPYKKYGYNSQESMGEIVVDDITCKNLIPNEAANKTTSGITFTINADKSITISGTATGHADIYLKNRWGSTSTFLTLNGEYTLSTGINNANIGLYLVNDTTAVCSTTSKTTQTFNNMEITCIMLRVNAGTTVNTTVYPQLEPGPLATEYVPHKEFSNAPKLLWRNSSPNTTFSTQDITLSSSDYNMLIWIFDTYVSSGLSESEISLKGFGVRTSTINATATKSMSRNITRNSDTSFTVASAYSAGEVDDNALIPRAVYGLKIS